MIFKTINPVDNNVLKTYSFIKDNEINNKLLIGHQAYKKWKNVSFEEKVKFVNRLSYKMKNLIEIIAYLITQEMGKPINQSYLEINKSINLCQYYSFLKKSIFLKKIPTEYKKSYIKFDPIGVILGIMPWNYPIWQIIRFSIPNILLGNVIIIKPSMNTAGCSLILEKIFIDAGFSEGIFQVCLIDIPKIELLIANDIIQGVSFTGSHFSGSSVGSLSGKYIKKSVLELGGNDAFVVLKDVKNIEKIAKIATESRLNNTGQTCISAKRFIIDHTIVDDFIDLVIQEMKKYKKGDLYDIYTKIGYISRIDLSEKLHKQYKNILLHGGKICLEITRDKNFFSPSLLKIEDFSLFKEEEIFGPIGLIYTFYNEKEIIPMINATDYGLGASIWTQDLKKAEILSQEINTGMVFINEMVKSDPRFPFGGIKKSGYGRELTISSISEFSNCKTIIMK
ncbi:aldehyde dehydrogenase family protein [Blattabacterium cuenoti]|uniref:aldehyde dehydrogenase family protein n=1 Tax=Blattabacterium cuenoti TaxID=1653831 RepID=UPI00163B770A|nr:aldehyde dehydrogenase family protein [Blattabacterium cuenoti]